MSRQSLLRSFVAAHAFAIAALLIANFAFGQSPEDYSDSESFYQPVSPQPVELGFTQHHASTAGESYLRGKSAVIQALGNYQLSESQASILRQQTRSLDRENDLAQTAALHAQRKMWTDARVQIRKDREARRAESRQLLTERQATLYAQAYRLSPKELDTTTGQISWPTLLQTETNRAELARLEGLFQQLAYGNATATTTNEITRSIERLSKSLRKEISTLPRAEYAASQKFLLGLKYAASSLVEAA